ncbi:hypothetical protein F4678DRAFT_417527 [Xylaria arbuscula]|nr:hypothetical protein F4678DRAFT_417527 [Xylaria arbuscula]
MSEFMRRILPPSSVPPPSISILFFFLSPLASNFSFTLSRPTSIYNHSARPISRLADTVACISLAMNCISNPFFMIVVVVSVRRSL